MTIDFIPVKKGSRTRWMCEVVTEDGEMIIMKVHPREESKIPEMFKNNAFYQPIEKGPKSTAPKKKKAPAKKTTPAA
jgi:hypothetical protein